MTALRTAQRTASATSREAATLLAALLTSGRTHEVEPALMSVRKRLREIVADLQISPTPVVQAPPAPVAPQRDLGAIARSLGVQESDLADLITHGGTAPVAPAPVAPVRTSGRYQGGLAVTVDGAPVATPARVGARTSRSVVGQPDVAPEVALADILGRKPTANVVARKMRAQNGAKFAYNAGLISLPEAEAIYGRAHKDADGAMSDLLMLVSTSEQPAPVVSAPVSTATRVENALRAGIAAHPAPVALAQELLDLA